MANNIELLVTLGVDDSKTLASIQRSVQRIQGQTSINLDLKADDAVNGLKNIENQTKKTASEARNLSSTFETVAKRIAAFSLVYGSINLLTNGFRDLTNQVIELDTKLVDLRRVLDIPDYEFNTLLERSIDNVTNLSGRLSEYLELVGEFGRTGLSGDQAIALADTATLLQNISDLDPSQSFDALTAAMVNFNIEARDSIQIADALNEVN